MSRLRLWVIASSILGVIGLCVTGGWFVHTLLTDWSASYDDDHIQAELLDSTRELLSAVAAHPQKPVPDTLPGYLLVAEPCWQFLQTQMARNNNIYTLRMAAYHNSRHDPYPIHDLIEAWIHIQFPEGTVGEVFTFQRKVVDCRQLRSIPAQ
jgi:hypothetical protein